MTRRGLLLGIASGLTVANAQTDTEARPFPYVDHREKDADLVAFLDRLKQIVEKKDSAGLLSLMAPTFRVEFAKGKGPAAFRSHWTPQLPGSEVWPILERLLSLGGTFYTETLFVLPYVYSRFPIDLDPLANIAVTKDKAAIRSAPEANAPTIGEATEELLPLARPLDEPVLSDKLPWMEVSWKDGKTGFVSGADVYSPAAHRAFFQKIAGKWRWITLACAD